MELEGGVEHNDQVCAVYLVYEGPIPTSGLTRIKATLACNGAITECDANAHNELWGSSDTNYRGMELLNFISSSNLLRKHSAEALNSKDLINEVVCREKIEWVINSFKPFKAASVDKIYPIMLQKADFYRICSPSLRGC